MLISATTWDKVSELFDELVALSSDRRDQQIAQLGLDKAISDLLKKLLAAHDSDETHVLDQSISQMVETLVAEDAATGGKIPDDICGHRLGNWRVSEPIARGAMAAVFHGERADGAYEQHVAIKLLQPGPYRHSEGEQLSEELRLLARLEHPGIARLLDGGISEQGWPYLVMEYVDGVQIDQWCSEQKLDWRQRIQLILKVCAAVRYAHSKLVVHADIKPSNVLVNQQGEPKLVDFGIAGLLHKKTDSDPPATSVLLRCSPAYAAPEQLRGEPVSTVIDVFGLGALMYELLTGKRIRDGKTVTALLLGRAQTDQITPLSQLAGSKLPAGNSGKDLNAIFLQALAQDPQQRYGTVTELLQDLRNTLQRYPVAARTNSAFYRLNCWLRRNWVVGATASAAVVALTAGLLIAVHQTRVARSESQLSQATEKFVLDMFASVDPWENQREPITVDSILEQAVAGLPDQLTEFPEQRARIMLTLGDLLNRMGKLEAALSVGQQALAIILESGNVQQRLQAHAFIIEAAMSLVQLDVVEEQVQAGLALAAFPPETTAEADFHLLRIQWLGLKGEVDKQNELISAIIAAMDNIELLEEDQALAAELFMLAASSAETRADFADAIDFARQAVIASRHAYHEEHLQVASALSYEATAEFERGNIGVALDIFDRIDTIEERHLAPEHPQRVWTAFTRSRMLQDAGRINEARLELERIVDNIETHYRVDDPRLGVIYASLGKSWRLLGDLLQARLYYEKGLPLTEANEPDNPKLGVFYGLYAQVLSELDEHELAEQYFISALEIFKEKLGEQHPRFAVASVLFADHLLRTGRTEDAKTRVAQSLEVIEQTFPEYDLRIAQALAVHGLIELEIHQNSENAEVVRLHEMVRTILANNSENAQQWLDPVIDRFLQAVEIDTNIFPR